MTFYEGVESLESRALSGIGMQILEVIADRKRKFLDTRMKDLDRIVEGSAFSKHAPLYALMNAGYINRFGWNVCSDMSYYLKLTEKGWDVVGNKPLWME